jgi:restriction endonuclease S subunit
MGKMINIKNEKYPAHMFASLSLIAKSHTLRCDAKQAEKRFKTFDEMISSVKWFYIGEWMPNPFVKGTQPKYIESLEPTGIPVINTLCIQNLNINKEHCRYITEEDYEILDDDRKLRKNDVLLTLDGGVSIGKPALFELEGEYTIDSHIAIIRSSIDDPKLLIYFLASPIGQLQFQRAESGASGQTAVTEDDIRRFRFPLIEYNHLKKMVEHLDSIKEFCEMERRKLQEREQGAWEDFNNAIFAKIRKRK